MTAPELPNAPEADAVDAPVEQPVRRHAPSEHVAWCRYVCRHEKPTRIVLCDSDAPGAFPVYRHPQSERM